MPAKTVHVHYKPDRTPPIQFSPDSGNVTMDASGSITFTRAGGSSSFNFSGITITPTSTDFTVTVLTDEELVITDSDADAGTYEYTITVTAGGSEVQSDPQIINRPE